MLLLLLLRSISSRRSRSDFSDLKNLTSGMTQAASAVAGALAFCLRLCSSFCFSLSVIAPCAPAATPGCTKPQAVDESQKPRPLPERYSDDQAIAYNRQVDAYNARMRAFNEQSTAFGACINTLRTVPPIFRSARMMCWVAV